jgi:Flp pilus assembly CpaF family ATPase
MTTIHASSPNEAVKRLESLLLMAGFDIPAKAVREQIVAAVKLFVQTLRFSDGTRKITHITEVMGIKNEEVALQDIFVYDQQGINEDGKIIGSHRATGNIPTFFPDLIDMGFKVDMDIFY